MFPHAISHLLIVASKQSHMVLLLTMIAYAGWFAGAYIMAFVLYPDASSVVALFFGLMPCPCLFLVDPRGLFSKRTVTRFWITW